MEAGIGGAEGGGWGLRGVNSWMAVGRRGVVVVGGLGSGGRE